MEKPEILQVGPYPDWDEGPLNEAYRTHRYFEAVDKAAFLARSRQALLDQLQVNLLASALQGLLPGLQPVFSQRTAKAFEQEHGRAPQDRREIRKVMEPDLYFQHSRFESWSLEEGIVKSGTFSAGADIREFNTPAMSAPPALPGVPSATN